MAQTTKEGTDYAPFIIGAPILKCFDLILKWVKEKDYQEIEENKDYWEIFGKIEDFEVTFTISQEEQGSLVNISVYGKTGKTRKKLKEIISQLVTYMQ